MAANFLLLVEVIVSVMILKEGSGKLMVGFSLEGEVTGNSDWR